MICSNLILTVKYGLFSENCCFKCRRFCCRVPTEPVIVLRWSLSSRKVGRITQKSAKSKWRFQNFCDRFCPGFKAKRPKILILEGLNYLSQRSNFSSDWPKNSAKSCNTGGCCSGGWLFSNISGVIINILTKFVWKHKIHSILYMIFKIKVQN